MVLTGKEWTIYRTALRNFDSALALWEMHLWIGTIFTWVTWTWPGQQKLHKLSNTTWYLYMFGVVMRCRCKIIFPLWSQLPITFFDGRKDSKGEKIKCPSYPYFENSLLPRVKSGCASLVSKFANLRGQKKWESDTATQSNSEIKDTNKMQLVWK